jgi:hypothetical protein
MGKTEFEHFGITKEQFDSIFVKKDKVRNYTFGTASAVGILTGCLIGVNMSKGVYETVIFILFFGCFLGSLFGAVSTIITVRLYVTYLYFFSPSYKSCRQYLSAKAKSGSIG